MIKRLLITVDGRPYNVLVEMLDDGMQGMTQFIAPMAVPMQAMAPMAPLPVAAAPAPVPVPVAAPVAPAASAPAVLGGNAVTSPLTGRVVEIKVQKGQPVKEGDHVITIEAMKMNTNVMASHSGTVANIPVAVGDAVEEGATLITIA